MKLNKTTFLNSSLAMLAGFGFTNRSYGAITSFSNTDAIAINDSTSPPTIATPYPASIQVTNLAGTVISKVTVQLFGITHSFPDDIDIVLVSPGGQNTVLIANVGNEERTPVTNIDLTLDDGAASNLPLDTGLVSGTFKPTSRFNPSTLNFPAPAPAQPNGAALTNFNNIEPNGTWNLFVVDDASPDSGVIAGGWKLNITTLPVLLSIHRVGTDAIVSWTNTLSGYTLQAKSSLSQGAWTNVAATPVDVANNFTVTNAVGNAEGFYRLSK